MDLKTLALMGGATARLTRFVTTDSLGEWWIKEPIDRAMNDYAERASQQARFGSGARDGSEVQEPWWWKYREGLDCPWCVGFWIGAGVLVAERATRKHRVSRETFRLAAGALALNLVTAPIVAGLEPEESIAE